MSEKLLEAKKVAALEDAFRRSAFYKKRGIDPKVSGTAFAKRVLLISEAKTCKEIEEIMKGPKPFDDSNTSIPEEEAIMWSEASLRAPLNQKATDRYISLMNDIFGKDVVNENCNS